MNRLGIAIAVGFLSIGMAASQTDARPAAKVNQDNRPLANGTFIHVALTKTINSNQLKDGQEITARTIGAVKEDGKTVLPSDALIEGRVTQSLSRSNGNPYSAMGIVFDKAIVGHGEEIPLNVTVAAIALPQATLMGPPAPGMDTAPLGYGAPQGGVSRLVGTPAVMPPSPPVVPDQVGTVEAKHGHAVVPTPDGLNTNGQLTPGSQGVYGLHGIGLSNQEMVDQGAPLITSTGAKVHLASGTQFMLVTR